MFSHLIFAQRIPIFWQTHIKTPYSDNITSIIFFPWAEAKPKKGKYHARILASVIIRASRKEETDKSIKLKIPKENQ